MSFTSGTYTDTGTLLESLGTWLATQGWVVERSVNAGFDNSKFCFSFGGRYYNFWTYLNDSFHNTLDLPGEGDFIMGKISLAYNGAYEPWQQVPNQAHDAGVYIAQYNTEALYCAQLDVAGRSGSYRFYYNDGEVVVALITNLGLSRHFSFGTAQVLDPHIIGGIGYITCNAHSASTTGAAMHPYGAWAFSHSPYLYASGHLQAAFGTARDWASMSINYSVNQFTVTDGFPWTTHNISQNYSTYALEFGSVPNGYNTFGLMSYISPIRIYIRDYVTAEMRLIGYLKNYCAMNVRYSEAGETFLIGTDTWRTYPFVKKNSTEAIVSGYNSFWSGVAIREA